MKNNCTFLMCFLPKKTPCNAIFEVNTGSRLYGHCMI